MRKDLLLEDDITITIGKNLVLEGCLSVYGKWLPGQTTPCDEPDDPDCYDIMDVAINDIYCTDAFDLDVLDQYLRDNI